MLSHHINENAYRGFHTLLGDQLHAAHDVLFHFDELGELAR